GSACNAVAAFSLVYRVVGIEVMVISLLPRRPSMIILSSLSEYLVLLGSMLLMIGLARLAYGGRAI
ncbi:hypothetical protein AAIH28_32720, partial [Pseudomonas aeruginosa]|uniref:hypothetical protein n=1 Tax=Pseudomonas aeruginosa TaxID=287 RepID=UPI0031B675C3